MRGILSRRILAPAVINIIASTMRAATIDALYKARIISQRADHCVPLRYRQLDAIDERTEKLLYGLPPPMREMVGRAWSTRPRPQYWEGAQLYPIHLAVTVVTWTMARFIRPGPTPIHVLTTYLEEEDFAIFASVKGLFELLTTALVRA